MARLYTLTFTGVSEEETLATLESLTFVRATATPQRAQSRRRRASAAPIRRAGAPCRHPPAA